MQCCSSFEQLAEILNVVMHKGLVVENPSGRLHNASPYIFAARLRWPSRPCSGAIINYKGLPASSHPMQVRAELGLIGKCRVMKNVHSDHDCQGRFT